MNTLRIGISRSLPLFFGVFVVALLAAGSVAGSPAQAVAGDLACGREASASSNSVAAGRAVDCTSGTAWLSSPDNPQQLQVDLGGPVAVDHVTVVWGAGWATSWKVRVSDDGSSWKTLVRNDSGTGGRETLVLPAGTVTRWVQLYLSRYTGEAGFAVDELEVHGPDGAGPVPTSTPPPPAPTGSTGPTPSSGPAGSGRTWSVTDAAGLTAALAAVAPGDTVRLADGSYPGVFVATTPGTAARPITLVGGSAAVLSNPRYEDEDEDDTPAAGSLTAARCPSGGAGYGLWLDGAPYWNLTGFTVAGARKGIVLDASAHVTLTGLMVRDIGYEGVHFRQGSAYGVIRGSTVRDVGRAVPGYGEAVYIGSARSNWDCFGVDGGPDRSDYVRVLDNQLGPNVTAEGIDVKEGTRGGVISGNRLDGTGQQGEHYGDSAIDLKGNGYTVTGNTVTDPRTDGIQLHTVTDGDGCANVFRQNRFTLGRAPGFGIDVANAGRCLLAPNLVFASNTATGGQGLTNVLVVPGG